MKFVNGVDTTYSGINLKMGDLMVGPGMMITDSSYNSQITLDADFMGVTAISIIREELKGTDLNLEAINKLITGSSEDFQVAMELLKAKTKYTANLFKALRDRDSWTLTSIYREYVRNNSKELSLEIL